MSESPPQGRPSPRLHRWLRRGLWMLGGLWLAYLVLVNVGLNVGVLPGLINHEPQKVQIGWGAAFSPFPGWAWVRNFRLRVQEPAVQWDLHVEHATTRVALTSLLHRQFHTHWVHAQGVVFHFRPRMEAEAVTAEVLDAFPAISGLPNNFEPEGPPPPPTDPNKLWGVRLEDVTVREVREVWIGPYRGVLDVGIHGRFKLQPHHIIEVGPASVAFAGGEVFQGSRLPVVKGLRGRANVQFAVYEWGAGPVPGGDILRALEASLDWKGQLVSLRALNYHLRGALHPEVEGGAATFQLELALSHGRLLGGSKLGFVGEPWRASAGQLVFGGGWKADAQVTEEAGHLRTRAELLLPPVFLEKASGTRIGESPELKVALDVQDLVLGEPLRDGTLDLALAPTRPISLHRLAGALGGQSFEVQSGTAVVRANVGFGLGSRRGSGALVLQTDRVWTQWGKARVSGQLAASVDLARVRLDRESATLSGSSFQLKDVAVFSPQGKREGWDGSVTIDSARLALQPAFSARADLHGQFSDARPFLALFGGSVGLPKLLTPLLAARNLQVRGKLHLAAGALQATDVVAEGDHLGIQGELSSQPDGTDGLFLCKVHGISFGLKLQPAKGVSPQLLNPEDWFHRELALRHAAPLTPPSN